MTQSRNYFRIIAALCCLVLLGGAAIAQDSYGAKAPATDAKAEIEPTKHPFLWVIKRDPPSYLYGTVHVPDERVTTLPESVHDALDEADAFYAELALDLNLQMKMASYLFRTDGKTLQESVPAELYERTDKLFAHYKLPLGMFNMYKTYGVVMMSQMLEYMEDLQAGKLPLDMVLYSRMALAEREVGGLETMEEQIGIFEALTEEQQVEMLEEAVTHMEKAMEGGSSAILGLVDHYLAGDLDALMHDMFEMTDMEDEDNKALMVELLDVRNVRMADRIEEKLKANPEKSYFFAVGAAHYWGDTGIGYLLEKKGFTIERIGAPEPAAVAAP